MARIRTRAAPSAVGALVCAGGGECDARRQRRRWRGALGGESRRVEASQGPPTKIMKPPQIEAPTGGKEGPTGDGRTSDVGYCVGWCCASRSSFNMCISVVLPALSRPWETQRAGQQGQSRREAVGLVRSRSPTLQKEKPESGGEICADGAQVWRRGRRRRWRPLAQVADTHGRVGSRNESAAAAATTARGSPCVPPRLYVDWTGHRSTRRALSAPPPVASTALKAAPVSIWHDT